MAGKVHATATVVAGWSELAPLDCPAQANPQGERVHNEEISCYKNSDLFGLRVCPFFLGACANERPNHRVGVARLAGEMRMQGWRERSIAVICLRAGSADTPAGA